MKKIEMINVMENERYFSSCGNYTLEKGHKDLNSKEEWLLFCQKNLIDSNENINKLKEIYNIEFHDIDQQVKDLILDLEIDISCANRDGLPKYAEKCQKELQYILKKHNQLRFNRYGYPIFED